MSIKVYIKDKALLDFPDEHQAVEWIESNPEVYNGELNNVKFFSDEPLEDLLIAKEEVKLEFDCMGCGAGLRIWRHPKHTKLTVICPNCGTAHGIEAPDVSAPEEEGDEY